MARRSWFDDARPAPVLEVAAELGLRVKGGALGPCPACGAETRGSDDKRPPMLARGGWWCVRCQEKGDAIALAALVITGQRKMDTAEKRAEVQSWFAARGWCDPPRGSAPRARVVRPVARKPAPPPEPLRRLPRAEVEALWASGVPVGVATDDQTDPTRWLEARGYDPERISALDLARALPVGAPCPDWAALGGRSWSRCGMRLLLPCYDARGALVALRARWTGTALGEEVAAPQKRKEVSPRGPGALSGTVYAGPVGRWILARGAEARPGGRPDPEAPSVEWDGWVFIFEGGPGWLDFSTRQDRMRETDAGTLATPAVLGVWSGGWVGDRLGAELAARLGGALRVAVATDDNDAGDRIAEALGAALDEAGVPWRRVNKRKPNG